MMYIKADLTQPVQCYSCGHFIQSGVWRHMKRISDNHELMLVLTGTVYIRVDGNEHTVQPGDALLIPAGMQHEGFQDSPAGTSFYWMHFTPRGAAEWLEETSAAPLIASIHPDTGFERLNHDMLLPISGHFASLERVSILFMQLLHIMQSHVFSPLMADYGMTQLLLELTQLFLDASWQALPTEPGLKKLHLMLEWIRLKQAETLTVEQLAQQFNFNADYLTRVFKKHFGVGVKRYILGKKMLLAKEWLVETDRPIKDIAFSLGFEDEKHFMKLFRQMEHMSPTTYRNAYYRVYLNHY